MRLLLCLLLTAACTSGFAANGKVHVVAAAYPFAWVAQRVGGPDVDVTDLVPPGAEPHDVELTPRQVGLVELAGLVVHLRGFQPSVDDALGSRPQGLDLGRVADEAASKDPHVWLDPVRMAAITDAVADRLAAKDPAHAPGYRSRAAVLTAELRDLDALFRRDLTGCARTDLVTSHAAFGYLAGRYGLVQRAITGLSPDEEPSPRQLARIATFAKEHDVTTVFFESLADPKVARTVAAEVGATTAVLDPVEGVKGSDDYLTVQRRNAAALRRALGCTG